MKKEDTDKVVSHRGVESGREEVRARRVQYLLKVQRSNLKYREVQEECKKG